MWRWHKVFFLFLSFFSGWIGLHDRIFLLVFLAAGIPKHGATYVRWSEDVWYCCFSFFRFLRFDRRRRHLTFLTLSLLRNGFFPPPGCKWKALGPLDRGFCEGNQEFRARVGIGLEALSQIEIGELRWDWCAIGRGLLSFQLQILRRCGVKGND